MPHEFIGTRLHALAVPVCLQVCLALPPEAPGGAAPAGSSGGGIGSRGSGGALAHSLALPVAPYLAEGTERVSVVAAAAAAADSGAEGLLHFVEAVQAVLPATGLKQLQQQLE